MRVAPPLMALQWLTATLFAPDALAAPAGLAAFEPGPSILTPRHQGWHPEYEASGDYGESWFSVVQTEAGGVLFVLLSITNLGLRTFDGVVDLQWYPPEGPPRAYHRELTRAALDAATDRMDTRIGPARAWSQGGAWRFTLADADWSLDLTLRNRLPPFQLGGGRVWFGPERSAQWAIGLHCPRGRASGRLRVGNQTWGLTGEGYHDHGWATIKMPSFVKRWLTLRVFDPQLTLILHSLTLQPAFAGPPGELQLGLLGTADALLGPLQRFTLEPLQTRPEPSSGRPLPTRLRVAAEAEGYRVTGELREARLLGALDVLAQVSWPVRMAIKVFYSDPYMLRLLVNYELDVTGPDGATRHVSGLALAEANYY